MKSDVETLSPTRVKLTVEVPVRGARAAAWTPPTSGSAPRSRSPASARARCPPRVIDQRFGRGAVLEEAVNEAVPAGSTRAVEENDLKPLGQPEVDVKELDDGENLNFTAEVDVRPEFDLPDFDGLGSPSTTPSRPTRRSPSRSTRCATASPRSPTSTAPPQDGDVLLVDLAGPCEGEEVEDLTATALSYAGRRRRSCSPGSTRPCGLPWPTSPLVHLPSWSAASTRARTSTSPSR